MCSWRRQGIAKERVVKKQENKEGAANEAKSSGAMLTQMLRKQTAI